MSLEFKNRATIARPVHIQGKGLHTGEEITMKLSPALPNTGIKFLNPDINLEVSAHYSNITDTKLATTIGRNNQKIHTIEHFMAACSAWGIDDLHVEINGPETPIMDGSSSAFVFLLERAGRKETNVPREYIKIKKEIILQLGKSYIEIYPSNKNQFQIIGSIDFDHPKIKYQKYTYVHSQKNFLNELCSARTFCLMKDIEMMREQGLIRGGCLQSAIVLDQEGIVNPEGLRYPNEFVRHKILDSVGDLYLAGRPILGNVRVHCGGHEVNRLILKAIFEDAESFEIVTLDELDKIVPGIVVA